MYNISPCPRSSRWRWRTGRRSCRTRPPSAPAGGRAIRSCSTRPFSCPRPLPSAAPSASSASTRSRSSPRNDAPRCCCPASLKDTNKSGWCWNEVVFTLEVLRYLPIKRLVPSDQNVQYLSKMFYNVSLIIKTIIFNEYNSFGINLFGVVIPLNTNIDILSMSQF